MVKIVVSIYHEDIGKLGEIGRSGKASSGYHQTFEFCLNKAIVEFIRKYDKEHSEESKMELTKNELEIIENWYNEYKNNNESIECQSIKLINKVYKKLGYED